MLNKQKITDSTHCFTWACTEVVSCKNCSCSFGYLFDCSADWACWAVAEQLDF